MKKVFSLLNLICCMASLSLFAQVKYEVIEAPEPFENNQPEREAYNSDGTYVKYRGDRVIASGFHKKKVFQGELKKFDNSGRLMLITQYKNGIQNGEEIEYSGVYTYKKQYADGIQTGYEIRTNGSGEEQFKKGPFFAGAKKEHVFFYKQLFDYKENQQIAEFDTIFLKANSPPEIHRWYLTLRNGNAIDTFFHAVCKLPVHQSGEYTMEAIQQLLDDESYRMQDFSYSSFDQPKEVIVYEKNGSVRAKTFPSFQLTFYPGGNLKDSIRTPENEVYCHFRYDEQGKELFKAKKDLLSPQPGKKETFRWTYDYLRNGRVFYTVSSVNNVPEKVSSSNDSVNKVIRKGEFTDYYGTVYVTRPDGGIDTSYSTELLPIRYTNKLQPGRYYYLNSERSGSVEAIEAGNTGIEYVRVKLSDPAQVEKRMKMKIVFQKDSLYQLYEELNSTSIARKIIWSKSGRLYSVDCKRNVLDYPGYTAIEQLIIESYRDSLVSLRSVMLTEKEFRAALNLKHISVIPKKKFMEYIAELEQIRSLEREVKKKLAPEEARMVRIESRQLFQLFYDKGFNPYFTEEEFSKLMESYQLTMEEKSYVKRVLRIS